MRTLPAAVLALSCTVLFPHCLFAQAPTLPANSVVNGASFRPATDPNGAIASGALIAVFGSNLASNTQPALTVPLSTTLLDTSVTFNDIPAPLFFVSAGQINAQVPYEVATGAGTVLVQVKRGAQASAVQPIKIAAVSPGIFTLNQQGTGAGAILHANTPTVVSDTAPAQAGEFLSIFATGLGPLKTAVKSGDFPPSPPPETLSTPLVNIGNLPALVTFSGLAPCCVALYQVNVQVPQGTPSGVQPLQIIINGVPSNQVTIVVK